MNKLEKGMYVRTEEGEIFKTDGDKLYLSNDKKILYRLLTRIPHDTVNYKVTKSSHNIIDLIEVGDYVNGYKVLEIYTNIAKEKTLSIQTEYKSNDDMSLPYEIPCITNKYIKSIVTKEQFSNMEYRLGDK